MAFLQSSHLQSSAFVIGFSSGGKNGFNSQQYEILKNIFASSLILPRVDKSRIWSDWSDSRSKWICPTSIWKRLDMWLEYFERQGEW